jgi:hypothetical protein
VIVVRGSEIKRLQEIEVYEPRLEKVVSDSVVKRSLETAESRTKSLEEYMTSKFSFSFNGFIEKCRITNDGGAQRVKVVTNSDFVFVQLKTELRFETGMDKEADHISI